MKNRLILLAALSFLLALQIGDVCAQSAPFTLRLVRDWGYGNGADVNGRMSLSVKGDEAEIQEVTFLMDDIVMAKVTEAPFKVQFDTNQFAPGVHNLTGKVLTKAGETYTTTSLVSNFLAKDAANQSMVKSLLIVGGVVVVSIAAQVMVQRKAKNSVRYDENGHLIYGVWGGAICSNCKQPFPRSLVGINLGGIRLERCPHCGKMVQARRATPAQLEEAERSSRPEAAEPEPVKTEAQQEQEYIEESKFTDLE